MRVDLIETFVAVVDERSFTRAAIQLNMTQPAVSARVRALEQSVGNRLLNRRGPSFTLTAAGERFLPRAREMLALSQRIRDEQQSGPDVDFVLRLGANTISQLTVLPAALGRFLIQNPRAALKVEVDRSAALTRMLRDGRLDIALVDHELALGLTRRMHSFALETSLYLPASLAEGASVMSPETVRQVPFIAFTLGPAWRDVRRLEDLVGGKLPVVAESSSARVVMQFVAEGLGAAVLPRAAVAGSAFEDRFVPIEVEGWQPQTWRIDLVRRIEADLTEEAKRLADILRKSTSHLSPT